MRAISTATRLFFVPSKCIEMSQEFPHMFQMDCTYNEHFVLAWTKTHRHLGNVATSRAEGQHGAIKKWIAVSTGNLTDVYRRVILSVEQQQVEIRRQIGYERANTLISQHGHICGAV
ncbi:hypothetical protein PsorP6_014619 [Peronosclerospora sorghi]|uniref:Uncharacterized protein n=1 Tax=Peronosclerospora sorghi TaxID=230839 RepID=A0ACC0VTM6_9STRA|nr:hypothetical protein PsorP6_014619 [Peronosclerospora sorghi]